MLHILIYMVATAAISCYPFLQYTRAGLYLEQLKMNPDILAEMEASALQQSRNVFTPVFLGVALANAAVDLVGAREMIVTAIFLLWVAVSLWAQRRPAALVAALAEQRKDHGVLYGQLSVLGALIFFTVYCPWLILWFSSYHFGMMRIVLLIDLALQFLLVSILLRKN
jgi:hypothetical protein